MLKPEDDFATWLMILQTTTDSIPDFSQFIPDIERLINSITETDELPDPLKEYKQEFINRLSSDVIRKFLNLNSLPIQQLDILFDFLKILINFARYGFKSNNIHVIYLCQVLVSNTEYILYKSNHGFNFHNKICNFAKECGFYDEGNEFLSTFPSSVDLIYWTFSALHFILKTIKEPEEEDNNHPNINNNNNTHPLVLILNHPKKVVKIWDLFKIQSNYLIFTSFVRFHSNFCEKNVY
ncbi:hypothetical protein TRFO_34992 [Tritrichomonas foetus]|uniref:Uncharacterized protein n=1 Tax=Tritrichomonas foetus TaxID=1144522 RepID=A0A1J4JM10_9EUKA|nr:hypothetical protein TRFO_34992 [Tritrichomonas foetus]|eukprot:OHS98595.1 hypothetical protein TRFO_34992 [Tritrichomonas foetus]